MTITEYADGINASIVVRYYDNQNCRWSAAFDRCSVLEPGVVIGAFADGKTPQEAVSNYARKISGKRIRPHDPTEREFTVPQLTY